MESAAVSVGGAPAVREELLRHGLQRPSATRAPTPVGRPSRSPPKRRLSRRRDCGCPPTSPPTTTRCGPPFPCVRDNRASNSRRRTPPRDAPGSRCRWCAGGTAGRAHAVGSEAHGREADAVAPAPARYPFCSVARTGEHPTPWAVRVEAQLPRGDRKSDSMRRARAFGLTLV